jgi:hypothetical protein
MTTPAKNLSDLPHFHVSEVRKGEASKSDLELSGTIDRTADVQEGRCFLLLHGQDVLIGLGGDLKVLDAVRGAASFNTCDGPAPEVVVGSEMAYVRLWQPYQVWMVVEPRWKWNREQFHATDAIARVVDTSDVSILQGEEVRKWVEIRQAGKETGLARFYPVLPSGKAKLPPVGPDNTVKGGWDHAHCELCSGDINAEEYGYIDLSEHWVCDECYHKYVEKHDLSFIQ